MQLHPLTHLLEVQGSNFRQTAARPVVREVAEERGLSIGPIVEAFDARIQGIVSNWAREVNGARAVQLGLPQPPPLKTIVEQYLQDFGKR